MPYRKAGIDVHKKMLAVVVSDVEVDGEYRFERRMFGSNPEQLRSLAAWLLEQGRGSGHGIDGGTRGLIEFLLSRQSSSAALQVALRLADYPGMIGNGHAGFA
jgi:hypothetical protein